MNEKNLTDEEIVKAWEICMADDNAGCIQCPYAKKKIDCVVDSRHYKDTLDLIHRFQSEKTEYERKLADGELVSIDWHNEQVLHLEEEVERYGHRLSETQYALSVCQDENAVQKAEIERLTEENAIIKGNPAMIVGRSLGKTIRAKLLAFDKMKERNAELQKQVNELLNRRIEPKIFQCHADALENCPKVEQAVKDTAKEILQRIMDIIKTSNGFLAEEVVRIMAKQNGVEVE